MAVTQFEATDARRAFPCWDEPNKKATFKISLEVEDKYTALSNGEVVQTEAAGSGWKVVKFSETPLMSTYLIAFVVGEIESIETQTKGGIPVRVWAPLGYIHQGHFALDVNCSKFFNDFNISGYIVRYKDT
jgi:aminopeptidase N